MKRGIMMLLAVIVAATASLAAQETTDSPTTMSKKELRRTMRGYKAFYEAGYSFDSSDSFWLYGEKVGFATSQGFQFNNFFYLGGGIALDCFVNAPEISKGTIIPVFAEARVNFLNTRLAPFFSCRCGGYFGDSSGLLLSCQIGLRYGLPKRHAIFVAFDYSSQYDSDYFRSLWSDSNYVDDTTISLGFKIGYEF